jgi:hypothetical protein
MKGKTKSFTDLALTTAKTSALRTMKRCVTLIREAIAAEFPSFDAVMAVSIFNLSSDPSPQRHGGFTPLRKQDGLKRLSNLFELDELALSHFKKCTTLRKHISNRLAVQTGTHGDGLIVVPATIVRRLRLGSCPI